MRQGIPRFRGNTVRPALLVAIVSLAAVLVTRLPARSEQLFSWDSVNFALGMERIDLDRHQPHPPGYFGYVVAARAVRFGGTENTALVRVNIVAAAAALFVLWWFALRVTRSRQAAAVAWTITLTSPLHWFYTSVAEVYVVEASVTLMIAAAAYGCLQRGEDRTSPWLLGAAVAVAAFCKLPAAVLMAPLVAYVVVRTTGRTRLATIAAIAVGALIALAAIGSLAPLESVWRLSGSQFEGVGRSSFLGGFRARALGRTARDLVYAGIAAVGAGGLAALLLRRPFAAGRPALVLAIWSVPYLAMCLFVHFAKPGYALPLLPPLALWVAAPFSAVSRSRTLLALGLIAALNTAQFALATPWSREEAGGRRRYADKTFAEKARTELNSILRPSLHAIRENDSLVRWFVESTSIACGSLEAAVLVSTEPPISWRQAMFYLPDSTVVQVPGPRTGWLIAKHRRVEDATSGDLQVPARCTVLTGEQFEPALPGLDAKTSGRFVRNSHTMLWTRGEFTMRSERDGRVMRVRP